MQTASLRAEHRQYAGFGFFANNHDYRLSVLRNGSHRSEFLDGIHDFIEQFSLPVSECFNRFSPFLAEIQNDRAWLARRCGSHPFSTSFFSCGHIPSLRDRAVETATITSDVIKDKVGIDSCSASCVDQSFVTSDDLLPVLLGRVGTRPDNLVTAIEVEHRVGFERGIEKDVCLDHGTAQADLVARDAKAAVQDVEKAKRVVAWDVPCRH